jgi:hypothetical protein
MNRRISLVLVAAAIALGTSACGKQPYLNFEVWEAPDQTSQANKKFITGMGGYHEEAFALLEKNDVDGTIKLIEADAKKGYFDWYNLAVLYEVKHDWAKAEECIQNAIKDHEDTFHKPYDLLQTELAYIQDHRARYVYTSK